MLGALRAGGHWTLSLFRRLKNSFHGATADWSMDSSVGMESGDVREINLPQRKAHLKYLEKIIAALNREDALKSEGLFRLSADTNELEALFEQLKKNSEMSLPEKPHMLASLFKRFLRENQFPALISKDESDKILKFTEIFKKSEKNEESILVLRENFEFFLNEMSSKESTLEEPNRTQVFLEILGFLNRVAAVPENRMDAKNLGIIFGPLDRFFEPQKIDASNQILILKQIGQLNFAIETLIAISDATYLKHLGDKFLNRNRLGNNEVLEKEALSQLLLAKRGISEELAIGSKVQQPSPILPRANSRSANSLKL